MKRIMLIKRRGELPPAFLFCNSRSTVSGSYFFFFFFFFFLLGGLLCYCELRSKALDWKTGKNTVMKGRFSLGLRRQETFALSNLFFFPTLIHDLRLIIHSQTYYYNYYLFS